VLVKVLAVEGNRIKLSRKAILKEQRAKMGGGAPPPPEPDMDEAGPDVSGPGVPGPGIPQAAPTAVIEGGADFDAEDEPNFNRVDASVGTGVGEAPGVRQEGARDNRGGDRNRRRRGRGGRPGGGDRGGQGGHGGSHSGGGGGRFRR
jgi:polyribonucleotide nucleotidyltransferase